MKKFAGLIMALMLCACLYAQDASDDAGASPEDKDKKESVGVESGGSEKDESIMKWNYGVKMWIDSGNKIKGHEAFVVMTIDRDYMLCTLDDIVDKGGGKYMVTFKLDNANGDTSKARMMLSEGSPIKIWFGYTVDDPEIAYAFFKGIGFVAERTMYVKSIDELCFVTTEIKPE